MFIRSAPLLILAFLLGPHSPMAATEKLNYPVAPHSDQVDTYGTEKVSDPYRPLEDDRAKDTAAWVAAENKVTADYLSHIPYRSEVKARLTTLENYVKYGLPNHKGSYYFFTKNEGLQNQAIIYVQDGLNGAPQKLLDPNQLSKDGTSRVLDVAPSKDGKYVAYSVSSGGSDWQDAFVIETASGKTLSDHLQWLKATQLAWAGNGFFYSRYAAPERGHELSSTNEYQTVYFHQIGNSQAQDQLIYEDKQHPQRFHYVSTTPDERYAILTISERGKGKDGNAIYFRDLTAGSKPFSPIVQEITNDSYDVVTHIGPKFVVLTNAEAPTSRVRTYDPEASTDHWSDLIPQKPETLDSVRAVGGKLFVSYTKDVTTRTYVYGLDGRQESEIKFPGLGTATGFTGKENDTDAFYSFSSGNYAPTIFRYNIARQDSTVFQSAQIPGFNPENYETKQVFFNSKDGTRIPMFLVFHKGLQLTGNNPTLLYAYGGFNISLTPSFSALHLALLEQGFVFAVANLRGGGEYGEAWHRAGIKEHKQNVFDDFHAAAEWLIQNKYTSPEHLAVHGISNGGLLIGATINQHPELFRVAIAQAGVMDMLRFQKFTIGWNWIADYGSSDNPAEYAALRAYSPLHNIRAGVKYPATLITTADHDDRVVPGHSFKYAATLQEKASPENPVLIRIDTNSGHGPSSTTKVLEQTADIYSFLFYNLGVTPKFNDLSTK